MISTRWGHSPFRLWSHQIIAHKNGKLVQTLSQKMRCNSGKIAQKSVPMFCGKSLIATNNKRLFVTGFGQKHINDLLYECF